jgi:hypothetical protein
MDAFPQKKKKRKREMDAVVQTRALKACLIVTLVGTALKVP